MSGRALLSRKKRATPLSGVRGQPRLYDRLVLLVIQEGGFDGREWNFVAGSRVSLCYSVA
jgi:hypothetical protein